MIGKNDMMQVLLAASPGFEPTWQEFLAEWKEQLDDLPLYLVLADYSRHTISLLEKGDVESLQRVFRAIERLHLEGDHWVKEAATIGLLESLQNTNLHRSTAPEQFLRYLGHESQRWWNKLYRFWENGELLNDD